MFHNAVIAGTHSGAGKTTWALGLMSFFKRKGLMVQPYKVGPDYIDTGFHHLACAPRRSRNLDTFFLSHESLKETFSRNCRGADLAIVEGVMGLYDGQSPVSEKGSTAEVAKLLKLPVFLVVDGSGLGRSAAALVKGYQNFDPSCSLKGVFLNRISGEAHLRWLREPIEKETGLPVLGWLPEHSGVVIPERHLGLRTALEEETLDRKCSELAALLEGRFDEERFLEQCRSPRPSPAEKKRPSAAGGNGPCRIGVAYDKAFSFYYEDNLDLLRQAGAELIFFSPLNENILPADLDAVYLGGGFPEIYAEPLSRNDSMKRALRRFHETGGLIYAECGGLIYLTQSFVDREERKFPLAGILPGEIRLTSRLQNFGYKELECVIPTFLFPAGKRLRSHEFHHTVWELGGGFFAAPYRIGARTEGYYDGKLLASYQHLHFGQDPDLAANFVRAAHQIRIQRGENCGRPLEHSAPL